MYPYVTNPIRDIRGRTRNSQDSLNIFQDSHGPEGKYNPIFKVHMLGGVLSQGLIAYITMVWYCYLFLLVVLLISVRALMRVHRMTISGKAEIMEVGYKIIYVTCNLLLLDGSLYHPANSNALVVERDHPLLKAWTRVWLHPLARRNLAQFPWSLWFWDSELDGPGGYSRWYRTSTCSLRTIW